MASGIKKKETFFHGQHREKNDYQQREYSFLRGREELVVITSMA